MSLKNLDNLEQYELFFQMEKKNRLFEIRSNDGLPIWDIVRYMISYYLTFNDLEISTTDSTNNKLASVFEKSFYSIKSFVTFTLFFFKKAPNFQFGVSKIRNADGQFYDPYYDSIKNITPGKFIFYESVINKNKYSNDKRYFDILPLIKKITSFLPFLFNKINKKDELLYSQITAAIFDSFQVKLIDKTEIEKMLNEFRVEYWFYSWFLKFKKVKRVFVTQNGVQKALFKASKDLNIPTFEFQHGDIVSATLLYNYGDSKINHNGNIIYPEILFTYSEIWELDKYIPSHCVVLGTNHIQFKSIKSEIKNNNFAVITSNEYNQILQELAIELANEFKKSTIYYKLHPAQFDNLESQKKYFKKHSNIEVVTSQKNISDLIAIVDEFVVIYSTAMYEILQGGKKIYIWKKSNYRAFKNFFNLPNVFLFNSIKELSQMKINIQNDVSTQNSPIFFKPFNKNLFINLINFK